LYDNEKLFEGHPADGVVLVCLPLAGLLAASESYVQTLTGPLKKGDSLTVIDDKFLNLPLTEWNQLHHLSIDDIVSFGLRQDTAVRLWQIFHLYAERYDKIFHQPRSANPDPAR